MKAQALINYLKSIAQFILLKKESIDANSLKKLRVTLDNNTDNDINFVTFDNEINHENDIDYDSVDSVGDQENYIYYDSYNDNIGH
jgi:hypothetical protein